MRTDEKQYSDYLEAKYLPGRSLYLRWFFYPKLFNALPGSNAILDLGCGTGEFLKACRLRKREVIGVDSNQSLANRCRDAGFKVEIDNICELRSLNGRQFKYGICDNVLEHLEIPDIRRFFHRVESLLVPQGTLICIVPGRMGFKKDPTHKTFVSLHLLDNILKGSRLKISAFYFHPLNWPHVDKWFYLNMQVFEINRMPEIAGADLKSARADIDAPKAQNEFIEAESCRIAG